MYSLLREICARHLLIHFSNAFHSLVSTDLLVQALKYYLVFYLNTKQSFKFVIWFDIVRANFSCFSPLKTPPCRDVVFIKFFLVKLTCINNRSEQRGCKIE